MKYVVQKIRRAKLLAIFSYYSEEFLIAIGTKFYTKAQATKFAHQ